MNASSPLHARTGKALELLNQLEARPKIPDWGTKVLFVYETLWEALERTNLVTGGHCDTLLRLLADHDTLLLVQNVVPELRDATEAAKLLDPAKLGFLERVKALREPTPAVTGDVDSAMFKAEKDAVYDADDYRTMLFLRRTERFSEKEIDDIREWMSKCPVKLDQSSAGDGARDGAEHGA